MTDSKDSSAAPSEIVHGAEDWTDEQIAEFKTAFDAIMAERPSGFLSGGLTPPVRLLIPRFRCAGTPHHARTVTLGCDDGAAVIRRDDYDACKRGCCEASASVKLSVPCDSLPHCNACECGSEHEFTLTDEQIRDLKDILP